MPPRSLLAIMMLLGLTVSMSAQYPDGEGGPGGGGGMRRGHGMGMHGSGMRSMDPVVVEGPPAPAEFARITSEADTGRYAELYAHFMSSTRPQRDSLMAARGAMRDAFENHDRAAGGRDGAAMRSLADDLTRRQQTFDDAVKAVVTKDAWKNYQGWRAERKKEMESHRRGRMRGGPGAAGPPDDQR